MTTQVPCSWAGTDAGEGHGHHWSVAGDDPAPPSQGRRIPALPAASLIAGRPSAQG